MRRTLFLALISTLCVAACAPQHFVRPITADTYEVSAGLGGPIINFAGTKIPMPFLEINAGYGVTKNTTAFAGLNATSLLYGTAQLDLGATTAVIGSTKEVWQLTATPAANLAIGLREGAVKVWPELDVNLVWSYEVEPRPAGEIENDDLRLQKPPGDYAYLGIVNWFELASTRHHGEPQPTHWIPSVALGHCWIGKDWRYTIEGKYLAPFTQNTPNPVEYNGLGGNGSFGIYLGLGRKL